MASEVEDDVMPTSTLRELVEAIPLCVCCGARSACPCLLDPATQWDQIAAWWREELNPQVTYVLVADSLRTGLEVALTVAPTPMERRTFDRFDRPPEPVVSPMVALAIPKKEKTTAPRRVAAAAANDDLALKQRPESLDEFKLTCPTEVDLKGRRKK